MGPIKGRKEKDYGQQRERRKIQRVAPAAEDAVIRQGNGGHRRQPQHRPRRLPAKEMDVAAVPLAAPGDPQQP